MGPDNDRAVTVRGIAVGCLMCLIIAVGLPYGEMVIQGTRLGLSSSTPAAFFLLFVLLVTVHPLLAATRRSWGFNTGELVTIFFMMAVATAIPTRGVVGLLLSMISGAQYYATPENKWADLILPETAPWMVVRDGQAVKDFYEGFGTGGQIPWEAWSGPLLHWLLFYAAFYLCLISAMVILRRQWVENERLIFPLAQAALAMVEDDGRRSAFKPLLKNPIMWCGFLVPFLISSFNALAAYYPFIQPLELETSVRLFRDTVNLNLRLNFLMLGFAYFINSTISFSLWFFYGIHLVQEGAFAVLGIEGKEQLGPWTGTGPVGEIMGHQMMGALIVMVLYGLWTARPHLAQVVRKAWSPAAPVDDRDEIMSYRSALLGFFAGLGIMWVWLWRSGFPFWVVPVFLFAAFVLFIGLARVIAEGGLPTVTPEMIPAGFVVSGIGLPILGMRGMIATGYSLVWAGDLLVFMAAPLANGLRLSGESGCRRRWLLPAIGLALAISLIFATWTTLHLGYRDGALNLHPQYFSTFASRPADFAAQKIANPTGPNLGGWLWTAGGGAVMGGLMVARHRFSWWPLHPLGFPVSMGWVMNQIWFSIFLAWLVKVTVLKYGGPRFYRSTRPFFLGVVLGQFVVGGVWLVIDGLTGTVGNQIRVY